MNPNLCRVTLRPRDPLEVFDLTLRFLGAEWRAFGRLAVIWVVPVWLAASIGAIVGEGTPFSLLIPWLGGGVVRAPFTLLAGRLLFAETVPLGALHRDLARRAGGGALLHVAQAVGVGVAALLSCGVAVPWAMAALLFASEVALLEQVPAWRGVRRTLRLAQGHYARMVVGTGVMAAVVVWSVVVAEASAQALVENVLQLGVPFGLAQEGRVTPGVLAGALFVQPLIAVYRLFLYVDCRTRGEGWDLQVGLRAAGLAR
jgi:hypothetical protein